MCDKGKKILILGNGFDLAHKLPTKYSDFLEFCVIIREICSFSGSEKEFDRICIIGNWKYDVSKMKVFKILKNLFF